MSLIYVLAYAFGKVISFFKFSKPTEIKLQNKEGESPTILHKG